jgi:hypothetical protein
MADASRIPPPARDAPDQWVDGPAATPAAVVSAPNSPAKPAGQQDMMFQWVDYPAYGRSQMHQPQYTQPQMSMYYPGADASAYGMPLQDMYGSAYGQPQHEEHGPPPPVMPPQGPPMQRGGKDWIAAADDLDVSSTYHSASHDWQTSSRWGSGRGGATNAKGSGQRAQKSAGQAAVGADSGSKARRQPSAPQGGDQGANATGDPALAGVIESVGLEGVREMLNSTLESIYRDRIKPMGNYVKGRLKERTCPEPVVKCFLEMYAKYPDHFVVKQPEQAEEAAIYFKNEPSWFKGWVDIDSPEDPYDEAMWSELARFLDGDRTFAGGRYGMARELMQANLAFLHDYSLGEICHIVQLAIQHRKLIVYHRKMLKPIQTIMSQSPAAAGKSTGSATAAGENEITDMDQLCTLLFRILHRHPQGVQLSRMKQMFKYEFGSVVSEMAFQCTKLSELFGREPLVSTFKLETGDGGKSMYVRANDPANFTDHMKQLYREAAQAEKSAEVS